MKVTLKIIETVGVVGAIICFLWAAGLCGSLDNNLLTIEEVLTFRRLAFVILLPICFVLIEFKVQIVAFNIALFLNGLTMLTDAGVLKSKDTKELLKWKLEHDNYADFFSTLYDSCVNYGESVLAK